MANEEQPSRPPDPGAANQPPSRRSDRDLIEAALDQASPRPQSADEAEKRPLSETFPGYEIMREIHRGGQGVVYQALQKTTRRKVAIKVIHGGPFTGSSGKARFEREVQVLGQLNHPNIVRIHDSGTTPDGSFFYVMDYISGRPLDEILRDPDRPGIDESLRLFTKICDAVNAAHLKGVIHRDIKPANVRLDVNNEPIVVDFGLAKIATPDITEDEDHTPRLMTVTGQFIGSLPWASPEQAEGRPGSIDVRTDVYSLGVVLYQMLTGKFPYQIVGTMRDVLENILKAEPARPSTVRRQINDEVETIVLKCLYKDRERRYQNAGELARDIRHYLAGEPIEAKRDSGLYIVTKMLQRYRVTASVAAAFLLLIVAFGIVMWVLYRKESAATLLARDAEQRAAQLADSEASLRRRAEENLSEGLRLAVAGYIKEVDRKLADLRGSTTARKNLIDASQAYLDGVAKRDGLRTQDLRQIADGYDAIGDFRGDLYEGRSGESAEMAHDYSEAKRLRTELAKSNPNAWWTAFDAAKSRSREGKQLQLARNYADAANAFGEAHDLIVKARGTAPVGGIPTDAEMAELARERVTARLAQAQSLLRFAQEQGLGGSADPSKAADPLARCGELIAEVEKAQQELLAANPDNAAAKRALSRASALRPELNLTEGRLFRRRGELTGDPGAAAPWFQLALKSYEKAGVIAAEHVANFEKDLAAKPIDAVARRNAAIARHFVGMAIMEEADLRDVAADLYGVTLAGPAAAARHAEALALYQQSLEQLRGLARADESGISAQRDVALLLNKVGRELCSLNRFPEADAALAESVAIRTQLVRFDNSTRHQRDLAAANQRYAVCRRLAADAGDPSQREAGYAAAAKYLNDASHQFAALRKDGILQPDASEFRELAQATASLAYSKGAWLEERAQTQTGPEKQTTLAAARTAYLEAQTLLDTINGVPSPERRDVTKAKVMQAMEALDVKMGK